jgi:Na+/H+ antiporter NhaD/arsenite permease-like protein
VVKDAVFLHYGFAYDNATIALLVALILIVYTGSKPDQILKNMIDRETIFFFMGLFIVIGGLEHMEVIAMV